MSNENEEDDVNASADKKAGFGVWGVGVGTTFGNLGSKFRQQTEELATKAKAAASGIERLQKEMEVKILEDKSAAAGSTTTGEETSPASMDPVTPNKQDSINLSNTAAITPVRPDQNAPTPANTPATAELSSELTSVDSTPNLLSNRKPEDISKEELISVLGKMNKRVKGLNALRITLSEKLKMTQNDKNRLLDLVKAEILTPADVEEAEVAITKKLENEENNNDPENQNSPDEIMLLQHAWRKADERQSLMLQQLQMEYKVIAMKNNAEIEKIKNLHQQEIERIKAETALLPNTSSENKELNGNGNAIKEAVKKHEEEIKILSAKHDEKMLKVKEFIKIQQQKNEAKTNEMKTHFEKQINELKEKYSTEQEMRLQDLRTEMEEDTAKKIIEISQKQELDINDNNARIVSMEQQIEYLKKLHLEEKETLQKDLEQSKSLDLERLTVTLNEEHQKNLQETNEKYTDELKDLQDKLSSYDVELKKYKQDMERLTDEQKKAVKTNEQHESTLAHQIESVREQLVTKHNQEMEKLKKEMSTAHTSEMENNKAQIKQSMTDELNAQVEDVLSKQAELHAAKLQKMESDLKQSHMDEISNQKQKLELELSKYKDELGQARADHANAMKDIPTESKEEINELKKNNEDLQSLLEEEKSSTKSISEELEKVKATNASNLESELEKIRESHKSEMNTLKTTLSEKVSKVMEQFKELKTEKESLQALLEEERNASKTVYNELDQFKSDSASQIEEVKAKVVTDMESKLKSAQKEHQKEVEDVKESYAGKYAEVQKKLKEAEINNKKNLEEIGKEHEVQLENVMKEMNNAIELSKKEIERLKDEHESELEKVKEAESSAMQEMKQEMKDLLFKSETAAADELTRVKEDAANSLEREKSESRSAIQKLKEILDQNEDSLEQTKRDLSSANSRADEAEAKAAAAEEDAVAIKAAVADDEESSNKNIEEALKKQRNSFECRIQTQQEKHTVELQILQEKFDKGVSSIRKYEEDITILQNELSDATQLNSELSKEVKTSSESTGDLKSSISNLQQQLLDKDNKREELLSTLESSHKASIASLEIKVSEREKRIENLSTSIDSMKSQNSSLQSQLENFVTTNANLEEKVQNISASLQSQANDFKEKQKSFENDYDKLKKELASQVDLSKKELISLRGELEKEKESHAKFVANQKQSNSNELEKQLDLIKKELGQKISTLEKESEEKEVMIASIRSDHDEQIKKVKFDAEAAVVQKTEALSRDFESNNSEIKIELEAQIQSLQAKLNSVSEEGSNAMSELKALQKAMEEKSLLSDNQLKTLRESSEEQKLEVRATLENEHNQKIEEMQKQEKANIKKITDEFEAKLQSISSEKIEPAELDKLKEDYEQKIKDIEERASNEKERLVQELESTSEELNIRIETMSEEHSKEIIRLEEEKDKEISAIKNEIESVKEDQTSNSAKLKEEHELELQEANALAEEKIAKLKEEHFVALQAKDKDKTNYATKVKTLFESKLQSIKTEYAGMIVKLESDSTEKGKKVEELQSKLSAMNGLSASLKNDKENLESQLREKVSSQKSLHNTMSALEKELKLSIQNSSATASSLLAEQDKLQIEKSKLTNELATTKRNLLLEKNLVEELSGKIKVLSSSLNSVVEEKNVKDQQLESTSQVADKLKSAENEVVLLREEVNKLKLDLTASNGIVSRLQTDKDANERKHGQRTALVGMLEAQVAELNEANEDLKGKFEASKYELSQKDEEIVSVNDQLRQVERHLLEINSNRARKNANDSAAAHHQSGEKDAQKNKMIESLKREVQVLSQKMAKKSSAAQKLLQEREAECMELRKVNKKLQREVDMGTLSDRRIFELAEKQSGRESVAAAEIELRDQMMQRFAQVLCERDGQLATAEYNVERVEGKVEELGRVKRREDVNIDYLKSIIVQYLSKPPGSSERAALLPVLATLLQFDENDYKAIEQGKQKVSWLWGQISPTVISNPLEEVDGDENPEQEPLNETQPSPASAYNEHTERNSIAQVSHFKRTSLQF